MTRAESWFFSFVALATLAFLVCIFVWQSLPVRQHKRGRGGQS